jgi:hypothetical protein
MGLDSSPAAASFANLQKSETATNLLSQIQRDRLKPISKRSFKRYRDERLDRCRREGSSAGLEPDRTGTKRAKGVPRPGMRASNESPS